MNSASFSKSDNRILKEISVIRVVIRKYQRRTGSDSAERLERKSLKIERDRKKREMEKESHQACKGKNNSF